jgi:hypothetical protein
MVRASLAYNHEGKTGQAISCESYSTLEGNVNRFLTENKNIEIECVVAKPQVYVYSCMVFYAVEAQTE